MFVCFCCFVENNSLKQLFCLFLLLIFTLTPLYCERGAPDLRCPRNETEHRSLSHLTTSKPEQIIQSISMPTAHKVSPSIIKFLFQTYELFNNISLMKKFDNRSETHLSIAVLKEATNLGTLGLRCILLNRVVKSLN